ncbi:hypothetical protein Y1Q_0000896 [Alligator mississippiensis]|uniref:Carboxymuconolactone decarboxylase-like domain-containing protein n=2 Tax=Alligator mississippiensis TaxID=8496 RepID=A0A151NDU5_ALLMI|nr:hypothetical protein Y1Q_0000896 [Alligator mississippiensis]
MQGEKARACLRSLGFTSVSRPRGTRLCPPDYRASLPAAGLTEGLNVKPAFKAVLCLELGTIPGLGACCRVLALPLLLLGGLQGRTQAVAASHAYSTQEENPTRPVGRYPIPNKKDMPFDIVELMEEVERKTGFLPNVFKVMSHRPEEFRAFFAYYNAIMNKETGRLSKADKELIIVATSMINRCPYCVTAHGALHRIYSKKPTLADQVGVNWQLADLSDREKAMLEFAVAVSHAENITEEHFQKLEAHGFDQEDAWDIGTITAFFAMSNRIAHFTDMRPNQEFYTMGRIPKEKEKAETS